MKKSVSKKRTVISTKTKWNALERLDKNTSFFFNAVKLGMSERTVKYSEGKTPRKMRKGFAIRLLHKCLVHLPPH